MLPRPPLISRPHMKKAAVPEPTPRPADAPQRRSFITELSTVVIAGIVGLFGLLAGIRTLLDPLTRTPQAPGDEKADGPEGFIRVAGLDALPADGSPQRMPVIADLIDAWNYIPNQPIGAVYLRREPDGSVLALHSICPHAGCSVSPSADGAAYHCPCHNSSFDLNGQKVDRPGKENPSPRPMDVLEVDPGKLAQGEIWIKYQDYYTGIEEKKPKL